MKKQILLLMVQALVFAVSFAQKPIQLYQGNDILMYNTSEIDSITHTSDGVIKVYLGEDFQVYTADQIDSISISANKNVIYEIPSKSLNDWDSGWMLSNRICLLNKVDTLNTENLAYYNFIEDDNEVNGIAAKYDIEGKLVSIESNEESFYFTYDGNVINVHSVNREGVISEFSYTAEQLSPTRAMRISTIESNNNALVNSYENLQKFLNNYADKFANSDTPYLRYFAEELRNLPENLMRDGIVKGLSKLFGKNFDLVDKVLKYLEDNDKRRVIFGECYVNISGVTESDKHHYIIGSLQNINQLPSYGDTSTELKYGILSRYYGSGNDRNLPTIYWNDNKWEWSTSYQSVSSIYISQELPKMSFGWYGFRAFEERFDVIKYCGYYWYFNPDLEDTPEYSIKNIQCRNVGGGKIEVSFTCSFNPIRTDILLYQGIKLQTNSGETIASFGSGNYSTEVKRVFDESLFEKDLKNLVATMKVFVKFWYVPYANSKTFFKDLGAAYITYDIIPTSFVSEATNIGTKSAKFEYGFNNVPQGGLCYIAIQQNGGDVNYHSVSEVEKATYELTGLQPNISYTYWAYIELDGISWDSNHESFTTKAQSNPSAITGDASEITDNSANVECTFSNVPEGATCGVEYGNNGNCSIASTSSSDGERTVNLSGLQHSTTYSYRAFIQYEGEYYYGETKSFTTKEFLPDVVGTWQGTQFTLDDKVYETFTLTLKADGTAEINETGEGIMNSGVAHGTWSIGGNGNVGITIIYYNTDTQWSTKSLSGTVDDLENPSQVEGRVYWSRGHVMGGYADYEHKFTMTR